MTMLAQGVAPSPRKLLADHWLLLLGMAAMAIPTIASLGRQSWSTEEGAHGPIILATGLWLVWRAYPLIRRAARPGSAGVTVAVLAFSLLFYVAGRLFDFLAMEVLALFCAFLGIAYMFVGKAALRQIWFPILYLLFLVPPPGSVVDRATAPLKEFVSWAATGIMSACGYPIIRQGVTLYLAQYQLLVEDACSGLRSLVSLLSISLFYIYVRHNASWRYALLLVLWVVPIAIAANIVRIMILVLLTYHAGDAAAQGFLHSTAGLTMFVVALTGIFVVDELMRRTIRLYRSRTS